MPCLYQEGDILSGTRLPQAVVQSHTQQIKGLFGKKRRGFVIGGGRVIQQTQC